MSDRLAVSSPDVPAPIGPYSQAVAAGPYVFCSGQVAVEEPGVEAQTRLVMAKLAGVLAAAGLGLGDVVKTTIFLIDMGDFAAMNAVYAESFAGVAPPARSTVQVAALPRPEARVEIEMIALARA